MINKTQYDCQNAPLTLDGLAIAWWNDVNGNKRNFSNWLTHCDSDLHTHAHGNYKHKKDLNNIYNEQLLNRSYSLKKRTAGQATQFWWNF